MDLLEIITYHLAKKIKLFRFITRVICTSYFNAKHFCIQILLRYYCCIKNIAVNIALQLYYLNLQSIRKLFPTFR